MYIDWNIALKSKYDPLALHNDGRYPVNACDRIINTALFSGLTSTLEFVYYVEPVMAVSILPLALAIEGKELFIGIREDRSLIPSYLD